MRVAQNGQKTASGGASREQKGQIMDIDRHLAIYKVRRL